MLEFTPRMLGVVYQDKLSFTVFVKWPVVRNEKDCRLLTHAPSTYKIPTARDVPADFRVALYESRGNKEPVIFRSRAVGEPPLMLAISVFSAITHALASLNPGRAPPLDAPATPEAILRAADAMRA